MADPSQQIIPPNQPGLTPARLIQTFAAEVWEEFIEEWAEGLTTEYDQVVRIGGAGDLGRDIIGHLAPPEVRPRPCDVFQCKHYSNPLIPTDIYCELAKLCVFTFREQYPVPRRYRFVPPRGIGPKLYNLLNKPEELKSQLRSNWDKYCRHKISDKEEISLTGDLNKYLERFDFSIVWFLTPNEILTQHKLTKYWHRRFKIDPPERPKMPETPPSVQHHELNYITRLLEAYSDHLKVPVGLTNLQTFSTRLRQNFTQSRGNFYMAESLARFSRDHFPGGFDEVVQHVFDGVEAVSVASHQDGFACLLATLQQAALLNLPHANLTPYVGPADKKGICHHLANDGKLAWVHS